jgi:hypothetical protein
MTGTARGCGGSALAGVAFLGAIGRGGGAGPVTAGLAHPPTGQPMHTLTTVRSVLAKGVSISWPLFAWQRGLGGTAKAGVAMVELRPVRTSVAAAALAALGREG